jgi:hypothetical protein
MSLVLRELRSDLPAGSYNGTRDLRNQRPILGLKGERSKFSSVHKRRRMRVEEEIAEEID